MTIFDLRKTVVDACVNPTHLSLDLASIPRSRKDLDTLGATSISEPTTHFWASYQKGKACFSLFSFISSRSLTLRDQEEKTSPLRSIECSPAVQDRPLEHVELVQIRAFAFCLGAGRDTGLPGLVHPIDNWG